MLANACMFFFNVWMIWRRKLEDMDKRSTVVTLREWFVWAQVWLKFPTEDEAKHFCDVHQARLARGVKCGLYRCPFCIVIF